MDPLLVTVNSGKIRGRIVKNYKGGEVYSFQGIPFAKPPVGDLRFKAPQPADPWEEIRDATKCGNSAVQADLAKQGVAGSEDCLYLNVYTKNTTPKDLKPAMIWIHGGAFTSGSSDDQHYGPNYFLIEDIVLVTVNYRIGLLGFLSFDDPSLGVTGNMGLKDQALAIKWVHENIKYFGGDPNNITIMGESAGGVSVHYQVLSPLNKGLIHKAILQSGVALNVWAQARPLDEEGWTKMGIQEKDPKKVLERLEAFSPEEICKAQFLLKDNLFGGTKTYIGPTVEKPNAEQAFITSDPMEVIKSGNYCQIPLIIGFTSEEGIIAEASMVLGLGNKNSLIEDISLSVPHFLGYPKGSPQHKAVGEKMTQFYFGNKSEEEKRVALHKMISDTLFVVGIRSAIKHHLKSSKKAIYHYKLTWEIQKLAFIKNLFGIKASGVCHGDDLGMLFTDINSAVDIKENSEEDIAIRRMVKMWTNFARTGNPTPNLDDLLKVEWKPIGTKGCLSICYRKNDVHYLNIAPEFKMETDPDDWKERLKFWKNIFDEHPKLHGYL